jgi:hypothetical protein
VCALLYSTPTLLGKASKIWEVCRKSIGSPQELFSQSLPNSYSNMYGWRIGHYNTSTHNKDGVNYERMDNNGIYGGENDDDEGDFTYHSSDGLDEDDENGNEVLGNGKDGNVYMWQRWSEFYWGTFG